MSYNQFLSCILFASTDVANYSNAVHLTAAYSFTTFYASPTLFRIFRHVPLYFANYLNYCQPAALSSYST